MYEIKADVILVEIEEPRAEGDGVLGEEGYVARPRVGEARVTIRREDEEWVFKSSMLRVDYRDRLAEAESEAAQLRSRLKETR